jgi:hypothetical protein
MAMMRCLERLRDRTEITHDEEWDYRPADSDDAVQVRWGTPETALAQLTTSDDKSTYTFDDPRFPTYHR